MKNSTHKITDPITKQHYKKSYLVRLLEEKEATKEIESCINYEHEEIETARDNNPNRPT